MSYPRIAKSHRFTFVCLFLPPEHASSMVQYLKYNAFCVVHFVSYFLSLYIRFSDKVYFMHTTFVQKLMECSSESIDGFLGTY